ncbi:MAG: TadE/TadG family type IV pilus assembly protein [Pirellulaceae bacterium]
MKSSTLIKRRRGNSRRGAAAVEFAMCLPLLLLLVLGAFEVCRASMLQHAAESAAYEGARAGVIPGATPQRCQDASAFILRSLGVRNFVVTTDPTNITPTSPTIHVQVSIPFRGNSVFSPFLFNNPTFRGDCELVRETIE